MAKRPTPRAAKSRTPATGRRNEKPSVAKASKAKPADAKAAETRRAKASARKPTSGTKTAASGKAKIGARGAVEAKTKKALATAGTSPTEKSARSTKARAAVQTLRSRAALEPTASKTADAKNAKVGKTTPSAREGSVGKGVGAKVADPLGKSTKTRVGSVKAAKPGTPRKISRQKRRPPPAYLAAELGQPLDHDGEPVGAGAAIVADDRELQDYTLHLWRQMQSGRSINKHLQAVERAGLNLDDVWMVGVKETLKTTSTPEEAQLYRKKLLFRANLLEAILSETVSKLVRLDHRADVGGETEAS